MKQKSYEFRSWKINHKNRDRPGGHHFSNLTYDLNDHTCTLQSKRYAKEYKRRESRRIAKKQIREGLYNFIIDQEILREEELELERFYDSYEDSMFCEIDETYDEMFLEDDYKDEDDLPYYDPYQYDYSDYW